MLFLSKIFELEDVLKLRLVTGAFEILHSLYINGPTNSRLLARETKVSQANFQMILRRLREESVIVMEVEGTDKRKRRYALAPDIRRQIADIAPSNGHDPVVPDAEKN